VTQDSFDRFRRQMELMQFETLPLFSKPYFSWHLKTDYVGRRLVYRPDTESTMDDARRMLERFRLTSGAICLAETQSEGRGRDGRSWVSPPDVNLLFTVVLMTETLEQQRHLAYVTPLAVALAVEEMVDAHRGNVRADLKWPNDVQIDGQKIAGVLIETTETADGQPVALVGVGINVNMETSLYPELTGIATSLKDVTGVQIPREELLAAFSNHFESLHEEVLGGSLAPFEAWRSRLVTLGREVTATGAEGEISGMAVDVDADGALIVETRLGNRVRIEAGDVTLSAERHSSPT
jgi:BirA family transcriptional regulator, biotin operon repressor / biotin---[acetyl-CoA-carboxylase] ligase